MRAAAIAAKHLPKQTVAATLSEVLITLDNESNDHVAAAIILAWWTCARVGCVLQLNRCDIKLSAAGTAFPADSENNDIADSENSRGKSVRTCS
jgi:hypothetical protein